MVKVKYFLTLDESYILPLWQKKPPSSATIESFDTKLFVPQVKYRLPWSLPANSVGSIWANIQQLGPTFHTEILSSFTSVLRKALFGKRKKKTDSQNYFYCLFCLEQHVNLPFK